MHTFSLENMKMLVGSRCWWWPCFIIILLSSLMPGTQSVLEKDENDLEETKSTVKSTVFMRSNLDSSKQFAFMEDRLNSMQNNFQDQIDLLRAKDLIQEKLLREAASEISQLKRLVERLINAFPSHLGRRIRFSRSTGLDVDASDDVSSSSLSWS